ncbi:MAG: AAA family ATPase [Candidatus Moranbacteria bacterium]|nr:AAA family ATPase [Candidatus Moranbacteria bacterium]
MLISKKHIVILGPPGIGKLTVGRFLADLTDFAIFDNAKTVDLALSIYQYGTPEFRKYRDKLRFDFYKEILKNSSIKGLISTNVLRHPDNWKYFNRIEKMFSKFGWATKFILLTADFTKLSERVNQPDRENKFSLHSTEEISKWFLENKTHSIDKYKKCTIINTTELSAQETANAIINSL